eukprot:gene265-biopygen15116
MNGRGARACPWMPVDAGGWMPVDAGGWMPVGRGCPWMPVDARGCPWMPVDASGCQWMPVWSAVRGDTVQPGATQKHNRQFQKKTIFDCVDVQMYAPQRPGPGFNGFWQLFRRRTVLVGSSGVSRASLEKIPLRGRTNDSHHIIAPPPPPPYSGGRTLRRWDVSFSPVPFNVVGPSFNVVGPAFNVVSPPFNVVGPPFSVVGPPFSVVGPPFNVVGPPFNVVGPPFNVVGPPFNVVDRCTLGRRIDRRFDYCFALLYGILLQIMPLTVAH